MDTAESGIFVGRGEEVAQLRRLHERPGSNIAVVYGRRRVGKTALIQEAFTNDAMLVFEGIENQSKARQIANFLCEMKYRDASVGAEVEREVQEKIEKAPRLEGRTVQKVLITKSHPTRHLVQSGYFSRIIPARDLLRAAP